VKFLRELKGLVSPETTACIIILLPIVMSVVLLALAGAHQ
jgi:hypothetical protein